MGTKNSIVYGHANNIKAQQIRAWTRALLTTRKAWNTQDEQRDE